MYRVRELFFFRGFESSRVGWRPGRETRHAAFSTTVLAVLFLPNAQLSCFDCMGSKAMCIVIW